MPDIGFALLLAVLVVAVAAPLVAELVPGRRLPAPVLEIVAGIVLGPAVLGWVQLDDAVALLSTIGLAFLLFLAGLEIDFREFRGQGARLAGAGFGLSIAVGVPVGHALSLITGAGAPLFITVVLLATSLGLVVPVLRDAGVSEQPVGQLVIAGASIADLGAVALLSLLFSEHGATLASQAFLLGIFLVAVAVAGGGLVLAERSMLLEALFERLEDTTAQLRIRGAMVILVGLVVLASRLGFEAILGAFVAGAVLRVVDRDELARHPQFRAKLEGIGFGFLVPVYFVASGLRFDLQALFSSPMQLLLVPVMLLALLLVRGMAGLPFRRVLDVRKTIGAGLLQATSLPFIVAATQIGVELGQIPAGVAAAMVGAGLLSVVLFPLLAIPLVGVRSPAQQRV